VRLLLEKIGCLRESLTLFAPLSGGGSIPHEPAQGRGCRRGRPGSCLRLPRLCVLALGPLPSAPLSVAAAPLAAAPAGVGAAVRAADRGAERRVCECGGGGADRRAADGAQPNAGGVMGKRRQPRGSDTGLPLNERRQEQWRSKSNSIKVSGGQ
jgi:hypothetical protein